ncbi:MAG: dTDP-4-dehydrorhamnose 3,5-epimerase [Cryomorphaceae bacterium]|nr:dTDP-4-dehydrorhamnose 3,5-epimerase [Cryomorphaceae bacterium]
MNIIKTEIPDLVIIEPQIFGDHRGYFMESFSIAKFAQNGVETKFVQDNESMSGKGVLRGLHFQRPPHGQGKLVRVVRGAVWDVAVDIRANSPTYGQWVGIELSSENKKSVFIPPGFAHGFLTLEDDTIFQYKCTDYYAPECEGGIAWNDPTLAIDWPKGFDLKRSQKDDNNQAFADFTSPFV